MRIGNTDGWTFFNGPWRDGPDGSLLVPEEDVRREGPAIQGHHYAFRHDRSHGDLDARLSFRHTFHSDVGLILRASSQSDFWVLHFPDCGQASRAQHFWAALSHVGQDGYLRISRMTLVRRVSSTNSLVHTAQVSVRGNTLRATIDEVGVFEASDDAFAGQGAVGLYLFGGAEVREASVDGTPLPDIAWDESTVQPTTWFHPCPGTEFGRWQRPGQVVRTPGGDLLLSFAVQERPYSGEVTHVTSRSADNGRSWAAPVPVQKLEGPAWGGHGITHVFPDGVLRLLTPGEQTWSLAGTDDDGRSWGEPDLAGVPSPPAGLKRVYPGPAALLNLADGSVLLFGYGGHDSSLTDASVYAWGSHHCQAFCSRSEDNGKTWTEWTNVDGTMDQVGEPCGGSLDLTEVCGVQILDGRVLALVRPIYSPWMWECWSTDGGRAWAPCVRGPFPGYATSNILRTSSGALVVAHRLPGCTVHTSRDDGRTWDAGTLIDSAIWVMGSMVEVEPDLVLYVYWDSFESLMRAQFMRITPDGPAPVNRENMG